MSEQTLPEVKIDDIVKLIKEYLPKMEIGSAKAVAAMQAITVIEDDEDREYVNALLVNVREAYTTINGWRTLITSPVDQFKGDMMYYERPLSASDKTSEYNRLRSLLGSYDQAKIEKKKKVEQEAAKKKERENHLVDIGAAILTKLNNMVLAKTKKGDDDSATYFKSATLENFDEKAEKYKKMKPSLKQEEYDACFHIPWNGNLFDNNEFLDIIATIKKVEPLDKWTEVVIESATPIINAWRAKIPELKQNLIDLKNADESDRKRIAAEQQAKADQESQRRLKEAEQSALDKSVEIESQSSLLKLNNDFVEQATTQPKEGEEIGPVKYVLKFTDPKLTLKAFATIIYHVMASPKFEGIEKKKDKKPVLDAQGNPEYIPAVKFWVDFFMANCDADVPGTEVREIAKVIVKK